MGKDASTIKQEIEQTRERMGDTVEALAYKADVGSRLKEGVADRVESVKGTIGNVMENVKTAVNGTTETVTGAVGNVSDAVNARAHDGSDAVSGKVGALNERLSNTLQGASNSLQSANQNAQAQTQRVVGIAKENPIGLALVGVALGFLTGSLLPVTDVERKQLGPIRDKVVDQAQAATADLVEAGKAVVAETAQSVVSTALSSAQSHGTEVVENAKARADQS